MRGERNETENHARNRAIRPAENRPREMRENQHCREQQVCSDQQVVQTLSQTSTLKRKTTIRSVDQ